MTITAMIMANTTAPATAAPTGTISGLLRRALVNKEALSFCAHQAGDGEGMHARQRERPCAGDDMGTSITL